MGKVYYLINDGTLSRNENSLLFENNNTRKEIPIENVDEIFAICELNLNTKLLKFLSEKGICLHVFSYYGYYMGSYYPREKNISGYLLVNQVQHYIDKQKRIILAKLFVEGNIRNLSYVYDLDSKSFLEDLEKANSIEEIMQVEGSFRRLCYLKLAEKSEFSFEKRTKQPPSDPLNALISFGNSLVYAKVLGEIYYTQLNPTISYLHEPSTKRFSLSLDVAEIFKPILSDMLILNLLRFGKIKESHFDKSLKMTYLNSEGRKIFISEFNNLLEKTLTHYKLKRKVSHRQLIRLELYKLIKHLIDEEIYKPLYYGSFV